jgi:hypothetical protein
MALREAYEVWEKKDPKAAREWARMLGGPGVLPEEVQAARSLLPVD